jgi:hypothetical protein
LAAGRVDYASLSRQNPDMFDSAFLSIRQIPSQSGPQNDFPQIAQNLSRFLGIGAERYQKALCVLM